MERTGRRRRAIIEHRAGPQFTTTLGVINNMTEIDSLKRKLRWPVPLRGFERKLYAAVLLSLGLGITWSLSVHDWQYFERSGSLVIVAAITMAWRDHVSLLGNVERFYKSEYKRLLAEFDAKRPTGIIANAMNDGKREEIRSANSNVEELISSLKQRLRTTEGVILCVGTITWGYGSLIGNLLWSYQ